MADLLNAWFSRVESKCESILAELKIIWDEVGESDAERDKMLLELEHECLNIYQRKVEQANQSRVLLRQAIDNTEAKIAAICSALGEPAVHAQQTTKDAGNLKEELHAINSQLEEIKKRECDRKNEFLEVIEKYQKILAEIRPTTSQMVVDESDLSTRRLEELHGQLKLIQVEKVDRLTKVTDNFNTLRSLCLVLGMDFKQVVNVVHPSLDETEGCKSITDDTFERLASAIQSLREVKIQRMQKLQDLATTMLELWSLMDTPTEEQQNFHPVTCNIASSEHEITEPNALSTDFIENVEAEVLRLEGLKSSKTKEIVLKKKAEIEELCRSSHIMAEEDNELESVCQSVESGPANLSLILEQIEFQLSAAKEDAFSRKEILERVEKWLAACEEEAWLEEYSRDENRYSTTKGTHLALKRAEKARALVTKIPAMVETLTAKTTEWEQERDTEFKYDGVRLLAMLEEYTAAREEKEQQRKRQRDQRRLQGQLIAEHEAMWGSRPGTPKHQTVKRVMTRTFSNGPNRKLEAVQSTKSPRASRKSDDGPGLSLVGRNQDETASLRRPFALLASDNMPSTPANSTHIDGNADGSKTSSNFLGF